QALLMTSCAIAEACASRASAVPMTAAATVALKLEFTVFWIVGRICVPTIAARAVAFSAPFFKAMEPSLFSAYQTGLDSCIAPAFVCIEATPVPHVGIHTELRYPACAATPLA